MLLPLLTAAALSTPAQASEAPTELQAPPPSASAPDRELLAPRDDALRPDWVRDEMLHVGESLDGDLVIYRAGQPLTPVEVAWILGDYGAVAAYGLGTGLSLGVGAVGAVGALGGFAFGTLGAFSLALELTFGTSQVLNPGGPDIWPAVKLMAASGGVMLAGSALFVGAIGGFQLYTSKQKKWMNAEDAQDRVDLYNQDLWLERAPALEVSVALNPGGLSLVGRF